MRWLTVWALMVSGCSSLALPVDEPAPRDFALAPDLALRDLATPDLAEAPSVDLAGAPSVDLATADLVPTPDVATPPDLSGPDGVFDYGHTAYVSSSSWTGGTILAQPVTIDRAGQIDQLGIVVGAVGGKVKLALYGDQKGRPGELLAETTALPLDNGSDGVIRSPVSEIAVVPGQYWVAAQTDSGITLGLDGTVGMRCIQSVSHFNEPFKNPFETNASCYGNVLQADLFLRLHHGPLPDVADLGGSDGATLPRTYGPATPSGSAIAVQAGILYAFPVVVDQPGRLDRLGLIATQEGAQAKVGLYRDEAGEPGELVAGDDTAVTLKPGVNDFDITDVDLTAGSYWLAVRVSDNGPLSGAATQSVRRCKKSVPTFSGSFPRPLGTHVCATDMPLDVFLTTR